VRKQRDFSHLRSRAGSLGDPAFGIASSRPLMKISDLARGVSAFIRARTPRIDAAFVKAQRRAHSRTFLTSAFLAWGCSVYQPNVLGDQAGSSSAGTSAGLTGEAGSGVSGDTAASSAGGGTGAGSSGGAGSGAGSAGVGAVGGVSSDGGAGGASLSSSAGADTAGDGGATPCVREAPSEFCTRVGKDCGTVDGTDNCGNALTGVSCGTCQGFRQCGGAGDDNVCGALTDPALGGVATASSVGSVGENGSKAFDLLATTKWYAGDTSSTGWLAYQFAGTTSHVVHSYSLTSANDVPQRDPADWKLQGSNNGATWVDVDSRTAEVFTSRYQTNSYTCTNTTAYRWYRLLITANVGPGSLQLAELVLYGK
jgi:hypothetical protein